MGLRIDFRFKSGISRPEISGSKGSSTSGILWLVLFLVALGQLGATPAPNEDDVIEYERVEELRPWLPPQFWAHRDFFFYPGMSLRVGPTQRDYAPAPVYRNATNRFSGTSRLGQDGSLEGYRAGQPFPVDEVDCDGDPEAGSKLIWNFVHRWQGFGTRASFRYTYYDRGEVRPIHYQGTTTAWLLKHRPEPQFEMNQGNVFPREKRALVVGFEVDEPPEARGTRTLTYRYATSYGPLAIAKPEDTWIYSREIRRVRKITQSQRSSAVAGTDFSFDDLLSFSGLPPQYHWACRGEANVLAPSNTQFLGYPYREDGNYGPSGLSYATDRWEMRKALRLLMTPKDPDHPYSRKEMWIDRQTFQPLYSFAYDRADALWKVIYHNHRWSEDDLEGVEAKEWYPGWDGVPRPQDLRVVSDVIVNVQTATGNRLDFYDSRGSATDLRVLRRYVDIRQLSRSLR